MVMTLLTNNTLLMQIHYKTNILPVVVTILLVIVSCSDKHISIIETTDIHGVILPYDFIEKKSLDVSLAGSAAYIRELRVLKDAVFLLDNGDNLQGQPSVYYYNFIDTASPHLLSEAMNWMKYDASTAGNHDIEAGHPVYDRLVKEYDFPLLAANAIDKTTGNPYFEPYTIITRKGIKIAVLGLITPAVPTWLPEKLYSGIEFTDMVVTARKWMPQILDQKPDLIIGLFHSGWDSYNEDYREPGKLLENGTAAVAYNVPGFDVIFCGHDHRVANEKFVNKEGDTILILNGGSRSVNLAQADISFTKKNVRGKKEKKIAGKIIDVRKYDPDPEFLEKFKSQEIAVNDYVNRVIGVSETTISSRDSYFGPSAFVDLIHSVQLEITAADISFAAPLSFDVKIPEGEISAADMFKLYRYENMLYTMSLSGGEIRKFLEFSYSEWLNTMKKPDDYLLKYRTGKDGKPLLTGGKAWLENQPYNFDSAAGIDYVVDVTRPEGSRIKIKSLTGGLPFENDKLYRVAVNSYRGNGGGGHLTRGVGLTLEELQSRVLTSTERDLRYFILKWIETSKVIDAKPLDNWKIVPEEWIKNAVPRERLLLFGTTI